MTHPRTFALALLAGAFALLGATMAVNFALDPQYVFGTPLRRHDENANYRYHRLRQYQAERDRVNGLLRSRLGGSLETPDKAEAFTKRLSQRLALCQMVRRTDPAVSRASGHAPVEGLERRRAGWPGHLG